MSIIHSTHNGGWQISKKIYKLLIKQLNPRIKPLSTTEGQCVRSLEPLTKGGGSFSSPGWTKWFPSAAICYRPPVFPDIVLLPILNKIDRLHFAVNSRGNLWMRKKKISQTCFIIEPNVGRVRYRYLLGRAGKGCDCLYNLIKQGNVLNNENIGIDIDVECKNRNY